MVAGRVGKEVAHLTYARQLVTAETKPWPFVEIAGAFDIAMSVFLKSAPGHLLGQRWHALVTSE